MLGMAIMPIIADQDAIVYYNSVTGIAIEALDDFFIVMVFFCLFFISLAEPVRAALNSDVTQNLTFPVTSTPQYQGPQVVPQPVYMYQAPGQPVYQAQPQYVYQQTPMYQQVPQQMPRQAVSPQATELDTIREAVSPVQAKDTTNVPELG
jgi:hypothetical protein